MAQQDINYGIAPDDGTGETFRSAFSKIQSNFDEHYDIQAYEIGEDLLNRAIPINDADDLYAHDSQVLIVNPSTSKLYALITYQCNKTIKTEYENTQQARLVVYNLHTKTIISSEAIAEPDTTYGAITLPASPLAKPRMHDLGTGVVRIYFSCYDTVYYRDLTLSDLSLGDVTIFQAKIRNSNNTDWDGSAIDMTTANLDTHLTRCTGGGLPTDGAFQVIPHISGIDHVQTVGASYFASIECYFPKYGDYGVVMLMESTDLTNWKIYPPVDLDSTTYANNSTSESSFIYIDSKWHCISRANNYLYSYSEDGGLTWSAQAASGLINPNGGSKTSADYVNIRKGSSTYYPIAFFAYNKDTEIYKADGYSRCTMAISITEDMINFTDIAVMNDYQTCHYPSIHYYRGKIFLVYTTSKRATNTDRETLMLVEFNPWRQLKV